MKILQYSKSLIEPSSTGTKKLFFKVISVGDILQNIVIKIIQKETELKTFFFESIISALRTFKN